MRKANDVYLVPLLTLILCSGCLGLAALPLIGGPIAEQGLVEGPLGSSMVKRSIKQHPVVYQTSSANLISVVHETITELDWHIDSQGASGSLFIIKASSTKTKDIEFGIESLTKDSSSVYCVVGAVFSVKNIKKISGYKETLE